MVSNNVYALISAVIVLLIILAVASQYKWLDWLRPAGWRKQEFVGAYGRTPGMQNCLAYGDDNQRWAHFNRCTYA